MNETYLSTAAVARLLSVPTWILKHAHLSGKVPYPLLFAGSYAYSPDDVARVREYFKTGKRVYRKRNPNVHLQRQTA